MRLAFAVVVVAVVAGCWRSTPVADPVVPPREPEPSRLARYRDPPKPSRCDAVVDHLLEVFEPDLRNAGFGEDMVSRLEASASESCHDTRWPDDLLDCFQGVTQSDAFKHCQAKMSTEQVDDLQKRLVEAMSSGATP